MPRFDFRVTVQAETSQDAGQAMNEMMHAEIDVDFEYTVWSWEITGDPDGYTVWDGE